MLIGDGSRTVSRRTQADAFGGRRCVALHRRKPFVPRLQLAVSAASPSRRLNQSRVSWLSCASSRWVLRSDANDRCLRYCVHVHGKETQPKVYVTAEYFANRDCLDVNVTVIEYLYFIRACTLCHCVSVFLNAEIANALALP